MPPLNEKQLAAAFEPSGNTPTDHDVALLAEYEHKARIESEASEDLETLLGLDIPTSQRIIEAIIRGDIRHVAIEY
jgi:hypothetical protein